jgi:hypothetical protein
MNATWTLPPSMVALGVGRVSDPGVRSSTPIFPVAVVTLPAWSSAAILYV